MNIRVGQNIEFSYICTWILKLELSIEINIVK